MSGGWIPLLGELTAIAAGVALSPFSVIPAIAMVVHSSRPRAVGLAFVTGWLAGKAAITTAFIHLPGFVDSLNRPAPSWTGWIRIVLGVLTLAGCVAYWRRPEPTVETPRWLARIKHVSPAVALMIGIALTVVNIKVVALCAAAGYVIGDKLGAAATCLSVTYFTVIAGSSAAVPILAYSIWAERVEPYLERFRQWMQRRERALTAAILGLIGLGLVYAGVAAI